MHWCAERLFASEVNANDMSSSSVDDKEENGIVYAVIHMQERPPPHPLNTVHIFPIGFCSANKHEQKELGRKKRDGLCIRNLEKDIESYFFLLF